MFHVGSMLVCAVLAIAVLLALPVQAQDASPPDRPEWMLGVNLAGAEFAGHVKPGTYGKEYTYPTAESLDYYKGKGLMLVRLPFLWERLQRSLNGPLDAEELARMDEFIASARGRGMKVVLDPHNYGRYNDKIIGTADVPSAAFADLWRKLADHYKDEPAIWAYGLMNEPHDTNGLWPAAAQAGVDAIRDVDRDTWILVPGDAWSGAASWRQHNENLSIDDPSNRIMYEAHLYPDSDSSGRFDQSYDEEGATPTTGVERLMPFANWLRERNAIGFLGEFGVPNDDPRWLVVLDNLIAKVREERISGTYWAGGPWWGEYRLAIEPRAGKDRPQMKVLERHAQSSID